MTTRALEGLVDAVDLLVEDLRAKSAAATARNAQLARPLGVALVLVHQVESEARGLSTLLREVAAAHDIVEGLARARGRLRGQLAQLVTRASEFDSAFPDGGPLLSAEHGEKRQMVLSVVAHLLGEFSFGFLADETVTALRADAVVIINTICSLHFDDWEKLEQPTEQEARHG